MYVDEQCILIPDKFAKARRHWLVIARDPGGLLRWTASKSAPVDGQDKQVSFRNTSVHVIPESPRIRLYVRTCLMRPLAAFLTVLCRAGPHRCAAARAHSCAAAYEGRLFHWQYLRDFQPPALCPGMCTVVTQLAALLAHDSPPIAAGRGTDTDCRRRQGCRCTIQHRVPCGAVHEAAAYARYQPGVQGGHIVRLDST